MCTVRRLATLAIIFLLASAILPPARPMLADQREHDALAHHDNDNTVCVLRLDPRNMFTAVAPPEEFLRSRLSGVQPDNAAVVTVNYSGTWPTEARTAFQYAVDIWKAQLTSAVPIIVNAEFSSDLGTGVLGSAGAEYTVRDFSGAPISGTWYAAALSNKLAGTDLYSAYVDISASFSSTFTWYYGTDRATPANAVDFVSVVLHELGHGLGFFGSARVVGGLGTIMSSGYPIIYDRFIENGSAQPILNFTTGTAELAAQLQGNSLYWNGSNGVSGAGGSKPRMYAPATWSQGSSYSHLNETTYPAGNANSLMTYQIGYAEAIHDPGPITRGMFTDIGWTTAAGCTYSVTPITASPASAGGSSTVSVTTAAGCTWTAVSNSAFITITSGSSGTGSGTVSYTVAANTGQARSGTMTVAGTTVTINQAVNSSLPTLTRSPTTLAFGAVNAGGVLTSQTPAQRVTVTQSGGTGVSWTASSNVSWLTIAAADATKTGTGTFSVTINNTGNALLASGTLTGTITITAPGAQTNPTIAVRVTTYTAAAAAVPFGNVDTPAQNATGVMGSIAVTGWALDDVGVSNVKIYRNCLTAFEPAANCGLIDGVNLVYLGTATFVSGARPDVEIAYPTNPQSYRGGWGYLMLTNLLPHIPTSQMYGGQGALTFYFIATDAEGQRSFLGRTPATDHTPTAVTLNNDAIAKPFGAIDTPAQGATVSGSFWNWGWALTPDGNTVSGETGDVLVPTAGTTMWVFLDGAPVAPPITYNQCRGTVGSPPAAGVYCNDDVSNIYGNLTPQPLHTARASNPTKFRNLDAGRAPIGGFFLDTTTLTNGLHQIAWSVRDSADRTEGIGSRYFTVLNTGTRPAAQNSSDVGQGFSPGIDGGAQAPPYTVARASSGVTGRTGFDVRAPLDAIVADADGVRHVQIPPLGRVELWLGPVDAGHLVVQSGHQGVSDVHAAVADDTRRALPAGSQLDPAKGRFTWAPGPAFLGTYRLVFVQDGTQVPVEVTIQPPYTPGPGESAVRMHVDEPQTGSMLDGTFVVAGWALDPQAEFGSGVGAVHVWAERRDVPGSAWEFLGEATLGGARPDVAAVHGARFQGTGFGLQVPALPSGQYDVMVFVWSRLTQRWEDARTVAVTVR